MFPLLLSTPLICLLWPKAQATAGNFTTDGHIRHLVATSDAIYVATEDKLYQLKRDLTLVHALNQKGVLTGTCDTALFSKVAEGDPSNTTLSVNVLLPFVENQTLVSCGVTANGFGYCELLALDDITTAIYSEHVLVGPYKRHGASVAFLVTFVPAGTASHDFYILTATQQRKDEKSRSLCAHPDAVYLHNTSNRHKGGIFSFAGDDKSTHFLSRGDVDFLDGFQIQSTIYLLANAFRPPPDADAVRLLWLRAQANKVDTMKTLRGASFSVPEMKGSRLVASSAVFPGLSPPVLWAGVFNPPGRPRATRLLLFDVTPPPDREASYKDRDFCTTLPCGSQYDQTRELKPLKVLLEQTSMTSVLATTQGRWMVFFVGTGDGQLIKLSMDEKYQVACPAMLYRADGDRKVFPGMRLDQADGRHVYAAFGSQVHRVPVSQCGRRQTLKDCWSAQDPACVWCEAQKSCTFKGECQNSDWLSFPDDYRKKMISYTVKEKSSGQVHLVVVLHAAVNLKGDDGFACQFNASAGQVCARDGPSPTFPNCTCVLSNATILPGRGLNVVVTFQLGSMLFDEKVRLMTCSDIAGSATAALCQSCLDVGCSWSQNACSWATEAGIDDQICQTIPSQTNITKPEISSITPALVSFHGHNSAMMSGENLSNATRVRIQTDTDCTPQESPVWSNNGTHLIFHIPAIRGKGTARVCVVLPDGGCYGNSAVTYTSAPSCFSITPRTTWSSGQRKLTLVGSNLEIVDGILHSHNLQEVNVPTSKNSHNLTYNTPAGKSSEKGFTSVLSLKVANETLTCSQAVIYYPEPDFTSFTSTRTGEVVRVTIQKTADSLDMSIKDVSASGVYGGKDYPCVMESKEPSNQTDFFICEIHNVPDIKFRLLKVFYGDVTIRLENTSPVLTLMFLVLLLIPIILLAVMMVYRRQQKQLTVKMNKQVENLELDIRNDIRQGFVDMQTEKVDLLENVSAISFLDYKHFASRIFFPENEALMASCLADVAQHGVKVQPDECCQALSELIRDPRFLTCVVHTVEAQKNFTIKDKCAFASLLTVALHGNLSYLTDVMEVLLKDLMQKNNSAQPKMLLRRTESVVEKLLTNWMSVCLYGFLRESVGQHLFLLVSALTQQIERGPVDRVTEKALYTLSEDWLLWQAPDFTSLRLKALFAVGGDGEVSEPLEVVALTCDTVEQLKEKILNTFKAKFGFTYNSPQTSVSIEFERDRNFVALEEVDGSSEVMGEVTMLNTLEHYKVQDGATIKVLSRKKPLASPQSSLKDDQDLSGKYFHLIDPDVDADKGASPERKKLKLKEVHLTKLLSTKVAVHAFVENLFKSVWGVTDGRAPQPVKYFFDFLDSQADALKILDPDVLHIWKTNSLPLRFWVNILKNPQFVFDMDKSPHLDGCLSVIAQAFMDSFSLSDMQLGKHTPTNKLLYAKDIPQYKQEVKDYYRLVAEQPTITHAPFEDFLRGESKRHENEFNEKAALKELYKIIRRYFREVEAELEQIGAPLRDGLRRVRELFEGPGSCSWSVVNKETLG
ncbi:plexin-C1 isoform X2 [Stigmatopora argus]